MFIHQGHEDKHQKGRPLCFFVSFVDNVDI